MDIKKLGLVSASMAVGVAAWGGGVSSVQAAVFFGEDLQHFAKNQVTDAPDLGTLQNSATAEQEFLAAIENAHAMVNFEKGEGFTQLGKTGNAFEYNLSLEKSDGGVFDMIISDSNDGPKHLHTSIEDTRGDVKGGRYGISDAGSTAKERKNNQFLNTNAGKDSNLTFEFSEATSAFGFYGTDFERGGVMGLEFTRLDGSTEYVSLGLSDPDDFDQTIRGTAFYFGYTAESEAEQFTKVRFDVSDSKKGTNDMVAFDRMTFAAAALNEPEEPQEVPEPAAGLLAIGTFAIGAALQKRRRTQSA